MVLNLKLYFIYLLPQYIRMSRFNVYGKQNGLKDSYFVLRPRRILYCALAIYGTQLLHKLAWPDHRDKDNFMVVLVVLIVDLRVQVLVL